jgi:hypothetical protein
MTEAEVAKMLERGKQKEEDLKNVSKSTHISSFTFINELYLAINNGLISQDIIEGYNFKPVYAAGGSLLDGLDLASL